MLVANFINGGDAGARMPAEGPDARHHLVKHHAQAVNVGAMVNLLAQDLLGAHVRGRAHGPHGHGGGFGHAGDAEVCQQGCAILPQHDVAGLDIPVHETLGVGVMQGGADILQDVGDLGQGQRPAHLHEMSAQGGAGHVVHDDEGGDALALEGVEADDVGMIEAGQGLGLAAEAAQEFRVFGQVLAQHLDGDPGLAALVQGEVDVGHAAAAEEGLDEIAITKGGVGCEHGWGYCSRNSFCLQ